MHMTGPRTEVLQKNCGIIGIVTAFITEGLSIWLEPGDGISRH